jgi:hypothetical protein
MKKVWSIKMKNKNKKVVEISLVSRKPEVKDGFHSRWFKYGEDHDWEVVKVDPWDDKEVTFDRSGWSEKYWVKDTKKSQWSFRVDLKELPKDNLYVDKDQNLKRKSD